MNARPPAPRVPWLKIGIASLGCIGLGYALMKTLVPSEEALYNSLSPQLKKQADATKAARIAREQALRTDARGPQSNEQLMAPDPEKPNWSK